MKAHVSFFTGILLLVFATGCSKDKPKVGDYYGIFSYSSGTVKTAEIEITEPSKHKIVINGSELEKDGKQIEGRIDDLSFSQFGVYINGEWSHKLFSKNYKIEGTFTEDYYQGGNAYQSTGTFVLKSY